jgi:acyl-CoA thioesterase I
MLWIKKTIVAVLFTWGMAAAAAPTTVLVVGDSLSSEYGLARGTGWVAKLGQQLVKDQLTVQVINASISGETTSGGQARLGALLKLHRPQITLLELGGNDALRGLPLNGVKNNLQSMIRAAKAAGSKVLLIGIQVPPNYGRQYSLDFSAVFGALASEEKVALVPFLLKDVADAKEARRFFQADQIHPNEQAQEFLLKNVWLYLQPILKL